ncbi:MAG: PQQ-dependent sugar dehydrogenase [Phycisphaerae bacterium]|nr:PQQ-dependent sugar dehydrogenase [Phycisphaerae bacterium]
MRSNSIKTTTTIVLTHALTLVSIAPRAHAADPVDPAFRIEKYLDELTEPTAIEFDAQGRLFIAEKSGRVRIALHGVIRNKPVIELPVHTFFECGLTGLALHPDYPNTPYLYVFATTSFEEQQILRYRIVNGTGVEQTIIRRNIPTGGTIHNGGCLRFGPDGMLYFSVGDNGTASNAQADNTLAGKVCRITPEGEIPSDNPFTTASGAASAVYAMGFRNPFRFCFSEDGRLFLSDVGSSGMERREEINLVRAGRNYGWPNKEGAASDTAGDGFEPPIFDYADLGQCITGIVSYRGSHFPEPYRGNLFQLDYTLSRIFRVTLNGDQVAEHSLFAQAEGSIVDITEGPDGRLYYTELTTGVIKRIGYSPDETTEPGAGLDENDWGGDPAGEDPCDNSAEPSNCANDNGGAGPIGGDLLAMLCGSGAALAGIVPLALLCMRSAMPHRRRRQ